MPPNRKYTKRQQAEDLAQAVRDLVAIGTLDPCAEEIFRWRYGIKQEDLLDTGMFQPVIDLLRDIKALLVADGLTVVLLSETYYEKYRDDVRELRKVGFDQSHDDWPIRNLADAGLCLPVGYGKNARGIYLPVDDDDWIALAGTELHQNQSAGRLNSGLIQMQDAKRNGRLSNGAIDRLVVGTRAALRRSGGKIIDQLVPPALPRRGVA